MHWYGTDDFDYGYFRLVWNGTAGELREDRRRRPRRFRNPQEGNARTGNARAGNARAPSPRTRVQELFDELASQARGVPVEDIKPALVTAWESVEGELTEPELTEYARMLSAGTRIVVEWEA
ncbi:hypothetical protein [Tomitella gaofuii]|uniref:hypothetical protein n=1 Tax=Tomitella gaofuii TaxID=2760083 RepID=UPI0015F8C59A|nr:hypothetical protein [Tomitella gaofuii]